MLDTLIKIPEHVYLHERKSNLQKSLPIKQVECVDSGVEVIRCVFVA